ncbi:hypothetical protein IMCC3135_04055 [Granulosicoccus antarcticus IMCC3135]|uniref:Uncharacterized protein n=1 Tax=Granulosicoccus antarcticus IMCC3135 TaxID=1192854 RepID=A0A2Z2NUZ1_9GAMM|nr:hypothetical protein IMCC3135_04055 [Granulosicoccus antarcticus IMCC3135]
MVEHTIILRRTCVAHCKLLQICFTTLSAYRWVLMILSDGEFGVAKSS